MKRHHVRVAPLLAPPLGWFALFFAAPMALLLAYAFGTDGPAGLRVTGTLANFARAFDPLYLSILGRSLWMAALATPLCLAAGLPVAVAIAFAPPRLKAALLMGVMLPFFTNLLIRTYALIAVMRDDGLVNETLALLTAGRAAPLMHSDAAVLVGLVAAHLPFAVLPLYAALDRLDRSLIEAALDLGASHLRAFATVVLPLILPGVGAALLVTFIPALGSFLIPDLLGGPSSPMIANLIERQFKRANDWPFGAALAGLLLSLTFLAVVARGLLARKAPA